MGEILAVDDYVGISFWLATAIMLAATVSFLLKDQMFQLNGRHLLPLLV